MAKIIASSAFGPMLLTALKQTLPKAQRIVDDPLAYHMPPLSMQLLARVCAVKPIRRIMFNLVEKNMPGLWNGFPSRKRYLEDKVIEALKTPPQSLVILGAGLETLAYRLPQLTTLRVYEVDLPENIAYKKKRLESFYRAVPAHVSLVSIDFETQKLGNVLKQAGYSSDQTTFFVWEGVTQYLTEGAVRETFQFLAQAQAGSRLVLTYILKDFIGGKNTYGLDRLYQRFRVKNRWWNFGFQTQDVPAFMREYAWNVLEDVGAEEYTRRYLQPAYRGSSIAEIKRAVYAVRP